MANAPFPDISHAVPELAEIADRLATKRATGADGVANAGRERKSFPLSYIERAQEDSNFRQLVP